MPSAAFQWWCQVKGGAAGFICTSAAKASVLFFAGWFGTSQLVPFPSVLGLRFVGASAVLGLPQRLKPSFIFSAFTARVNSCPSRASFLASVCRFGKEVASRVVPFAFPVACAGKEPAAPPFAVFERWESMLRAGIGFGLPSACFGGDSVRVNAGAAGCVVPSPSTPLRADFSKTTRGAPSRTSAAKAGLHFLGFYGTSELVPFPSVAGLRVLCSAASVLGGG